MTKKQLLNLVAPKAHSTKRAAEEVIEVFLGEIMKGLARGEKIVLSGFGTFRVVKVKDKPVIVPGTTEKRIVKGHRAARFSPGKPLKKAVR